MTKFQWAFLAVFFLNFVQGQKRDAADIEIVPMLGYSTSDYSGENSKLFGNLSGVNFGAHADLYLSDRWSIRSGAFYQKMGATFDRDKEIHTYLTVPLNMNWHFGGNRGWNLNFGPSFGVLLDSRYESNGQSTDSLLPARNFQAGISLGIGYKFEISEKISLLIDYQESASITNVYRDSAIDLRNSYSSFNVGAVFSL